MKKRFLPLLLALALLACLPAPALAADNFDAQISALNAQRAQLQRQKAALGYSTTTILGGRVISQNADCWIIEGGGFSVSGGGADYYAVYDPQNGSTALGLYTGEHLNAGTVTVTVEGVSRTAAVLQALPSDYRALKTQIDSLTREMLALEEQKKAGHKQEMLEKGQSAIDAYNALQPQRDVFRWYNADPSSQILFQLDNPYYMAYGDLALIEDNNYDARPVALNGSTLIPARPLMDAVGGVTEWTPERPDQVALTFKDKQILLTLNSTTATVNGQAVAMPAAAQIVGGKTMIPLRFVSETFEMRVDWLPQDQMVQIIFPKTQGGFGEPFAVPLGNGRWQVVDNRFTPAVTFTITSGDEVVLEPKDTGELDVKVLDPEKSAYSSVPWYRHTFWYRKDVRPTEFWPVQGMKPYEGELSPQVGEALHGKGYGTPEYYAIQLPALGEDFWLYISPSSSQDFDALRALIEEAIRTIDISE